MSDNKAKGFQIAFDTAVKVLMCDRLGSIVSADKQIKVRGADY